MPHLTLVLSFLFSQVLAVNGMWKRDADGGRGLEESWVFFSLYS